MQGSRKGSQAPDMWKCFSRMTDPTTGKHPYEYLLSNRIFMSLRKLQPPRTLESRMQLCFLYRGFTSPAYRGWKIHPFPRSKSTGEEIVLMQGPKVALSPITNAMSVDVEDHFHTEMMSRVIPRANWNHLPCRVEQSTQVLFEQFERAGVRGTFFFLGWVADRFPALVRKAAQLGHEIACHSYWHRQVNTLTPDQFREDTARAKKTIEDAAGVRVIGYRAPSFSMIPGTEWAKEILAELGFLYDSSVHPIRHDLYGNHDAPRQPYRDKPAGLLEIPISTIRLFKNNYPFAGGGYFRLLPYGIVRWGIRQINMRESMPAVFYIHPWEIDVVRPFLTNERKIMMRQYIRIGNTLRGLNQMTTEFPFAPISEVYRQSLHKDF